MSTTLESPKALDLALQLDADQRTSWLAHLFRPFSNEGMEDLLDWRFLGISSLKSSTFGIDEVSFFELSEPWKKQQDQPVKDESSTPSIATNSEDSLMMGNGQSTTTTRVRNTTAAHSNRTVVMSLDTQVFKPSKRQVYYLFPSDAIVEKMSETPPYEVSTNLKKSVNGIISKHLFSSFVMPHVDQLFCSFHALDGIQKQQGIGMAEHPSGSSLDKQQCYTDFPSSPLLSDTTTPDVKMQHSVIKASLLTTHLSLSGISKELYLILKDSVSRFEVAYEKMVQLMKLHTQGLSHRCAELLLTDGHLVQPKKPKSELKINKGKRKGSYQQRLISPKTPLAIAPAVSFVSSTCLSSKAKSIPSTPKQPSFSPPMATTTVSTPITPSAPPPPPQPHPSTASSTSSPRQSSTLGRKCFYCGSKTTPMWRRGPDGAGTLCNACGVKWKHGKILCGQPIDGTPDQQKKRKQQVKLKKDKRIKMQQQRQQHGSIQVEEDLHSNDGDEEEDDDDDEEDNFSYEEDDDDDDDEEEEQMKHNIVAARHLTIHESPYTSASLDDSTAAYHQYDNGQHPYYEQRPRRHTADVSVLERGGPWVDYPLSMGVDAVEAATVLTLLKRSSQT
ncbi:hypothetical protein [Absidia glauca]|uniref:GATA-type domain-containing protein n=1 Tax=Absidia glauca TaxID=4829 RepID=A0A163J450_ABSGL|nr:hypothetical protein [Absidia glauca]